MRGGFRLILSMGTQCKGVQCCRAAGAAPSEHFAEGAATDLFEPLESTTQQLRFIWCCIHVVTEPVLWSSTSELQTR